MPADVQQILLEEVDRAVDWIHDKFAQWEVEDLETFKKHRFNIYVISDNEREKWCERLRTYQEKQLSSMGEFGTEVKEIVDDVNSKYPYHVKTIEAE